MSVRIWVPTVCKGYQKMTKFDTTKTRAISIKSISFVKRVGPDLGQNCSQRLSADDNEKELRNPLNLGVTRTDGESQWTTKLIDCLMFNNTTTIVGH